MRVFTSISHCYRYARDITIALLLLLPLLSQPAHADITPTINYQGFLVDSDGDPINDSIHDIRFVFHSSRTADAPKFSDARCNISIINGRYEVEIGSETGGITPNIFENNAAIWLEIQIDLENDCNDFTEHLEPRIRMQAAPYAFESLHASTASAASPNFRAARIVPLDPDVLGITVSTHLFVSGGDLQVGDSPSITISSSGYLTLANLTSEPGVSAGRIFFDSLAKQLKISLDGFNFVPIATGTAAGLSTVISNFSEFTGAGITGSELKLLPSSVTLQGNIFNTADSLVMLDAASRLPAVSGSLLSGVILSTDTLQSGATFYVSSGTVNILTVSTLTVATLLKVTGTAQLRGAPAYDGLFVNSSGNVFVGTMTLPISGRFNVKGSGDAGKYLTVIYSGDQIAAWVRNKP